MKNGLFINPLNDLGGRSIAAQDVLTLPSISAPISVLPPPFFVFFNQLKYPDVDLQSTEFTAGINKLAESFDRVCVHSIGQWETTVVTTRGSDTLKSLREICAHNGVSLRAVTGEDELPA